MKVGLIGFGQAGKSTLYRAAARGQAKGSVTAVPVPDPRFDQIVAQVRPKKATPATVILHDDIESAQGGTSKVLSQRTLDAARKMDLLLHVVRAFDNPAAPYFAEVDPLRDEENLAVELVLSDLQVVENRLERLGKSLNARNPGHPEYMEKLAMERFREALEGGTPLRALDLDENETMMVRNYQFLSGKPMVVAFNVGEDAVSEPPASIREHMVALASKETPAFAVSAPVEEEIAQLDPADQPEFLASMGLKESAGAKVVQAVYRALGLITFYTAGENETRAWPLRQGSTALKAADTIHSDIARGFIRAEVVRWTDYVEHGSLEAAYSANKMRLEGKDALIQDGDLIHIRNKS